jgi:hypothetical protein
MTVAHRLTERDRSILTMLYRHRVFTTDQLAEMYFDNTNTAQHRLTTLYRLRLVDRFQPLDDRYASLPYHYVLDQLGAMVVAAERGEDPDTSRRQADRHRSATEGCGYGSLSWPACPFRRSPRNGSPRPWRTGAEQSSSGNTCSEWHALTHRSWQSAQGRPGDEGATRVPASPRRTKRHLKGTCGFPSSRDIETPVRGREGSAADGDGLGE